MISKKMGIIIGAIAVLVMGTFIALPRITDIYEKSRLQPDLELSAAVERMMNLSSCNFEIVSSFSLEGRTQVISSVQGEKEGQNVHIKGEMVKTPVDIYYIDGTIYNYDATASKWMVIESGTTSTAELLISELKPLNYLMYADIQNIQKIGFENIDGDNCLQLQFNSVMKNDLLNKMWKDFNCSLWIDYRHDVIKKLELSALNKNNNQTTLLINMSFKNIDKKFTIEPPDLAAKQS